MSMRPKIKSPVCSYANRAPTDIIIPQLYASVKKNHPPPREICVLHKNNGLILEDLSIEKITPLCYLIVRKGDTNVLSKTPKKVPFECSFLPFGKAPLRQKMCALIS